MNRQLLAVCCWIAPALLLGCGAQKGTPSEAETTQDVKKAIAWINATEGNTFQGSAIFIKSGEKIELSVQIDPGPPGVHAVHIHEHGDCSAPDGTSAGGHWNPGGQDHGKWGVEPFHLGDIGNITVGEDGTGKLTLITDLWSMGTGAENDILDRAIIVHAGADDFTTQPTGNAGARIGCGVIRAQ